MVLLAPENGWMAEGRRPWIQSRGGAGVEAGHWQLNDRRENIYNFDSLQVIGSRRACQVLIGWKERMS